MKIFDFQGLNRFKQLKKGMFFTIDSIIAAAILFSVIVLNSSIYVNEQPSFNLNFMSQDIIRTLSSLTVNEIDNVYIDERISSGDITKLDNTILEQVVEFWAKGDIPFANRTLSNVTDLFVPENLGFGMWIDNESIYTRSTPVKNSLVSSKKIISGFSKGQTSGDTRKIPPTLLGPVIVEVRIWN